MSLLLSLLKRQSCWPSGLGYVLLMPLGVSSVVAAEHVYLSRTESGLPVYTNTASTTKPSRLVMIFELPPARPRSSLERIPLRRVTESQRGQLGVDVNAGVDALIKRAAVVYGIEEALLRALIRVESGFNPLARSKAGAIGLMQVMPATGRRYGVVHLEDAVQNVDAGSRYLKDLLQMFGGDRSLALAAYNAGEGAVIKHGYKIPPYRETQAYVPAVLAHYQTYLAAERKFGGIKLAQTEQ
jgi:hypothetical protein